MPICRWCQGEVRHTNPSLGAYCSKRCRSSAALALLDAAEQAERVAVAGGAPPGSGFFSAAAEEYARVVSESDGTDPSAIAAKLVGAIFGRTVGRRVVDRFTQATARQVPPPPRQAAPPPVQPPPQEWAGETEWSWRGRTARARGEPQPQVSQPPPRRNQDEDRDEARAGGRPRKPQPPKPPSEKDILLGKLGLPPTAGWPDVEARYRDLAPTLHPDIAGGDGAPMKDLNLTRQRLKVLLK